MKTAWSITAGLDLEDAVSEAEYAMEQGGYAGKPIVVPAEGDPALDHLRELVGRIVGRPVRFFASDGQLGEYQAETDGHSYICVRPTTNLLTILHEAAHIRCGKLGHGVAFARTFHGLIKEHLGQRAASRFWSLIGPAVEQQDAKNNRWFTAAAAGESYQRLPVGLLRRDRKVFLERGPKGVGFHQTWLVWFRLPESVLTRYDDGFVHTTAMWGSEVRALDFVSAGALADDGGLYGQAFEATSIDEAKAIVARYLPQLDG